MSSLRLSWIIGLASLLTDILGGESPKDGFGQMSARLYISKLEKSSKTRGKKSLRVTC